MSDLEKLKKTYTELGVEFKEITAISRGAETETDGYIDAILWDTKVELSGGIGYPNFECRFYFLDGKCKGHGVWE